LNPAALVIAFSGRLETKMEHSTTQIGKILKRDFSALARSMRLVAILAALISVLGGLSFAQSGTMTTLAGLNTVVNRSNPTAAPDITIAVGTLEYCEHVNSSYQCWYKGGSQANQPVHFLGTSNPKSDSGPWSQNNNNSGNTPNCPTAYTPNSQLLHDNVYNLWILEKRITSMLNSRNYMCVAISNVEDIASTSPVFGWFAFEYDLDLVIPTNSRGNFYYPDYPQTGLWQSSTSTTPPYTAATDQAMWITYDLQDVNNFSNVMGVLVCAVDLAGLRASTASPWNNNSKTPACVVAHPLVTYNQRRSWVPANNSDTAPPISADGEMFTYMISPPKDGHTYLTDPNHTQGVEQWTINWSSPAPAPMFVNSWDMPSTQTGGDQLGCFTASSFYNTVCIPQPSTATTGKHIDSVADRMQQFFHYTSNGGTGSVWTSAHAIQIAPSSSSLTQTEADIRILQRNAAPPNAVYLANDFPILDPADSNAYVFLPSVVRDKAGNLQGILGISGSGTNEHPGLDSWNFIPSSLTSSTYGYIASPLNDGDAEDVDNLNYRWGDWYSAVLDPSDGCTVWVAGEYLPVNRTTEPYWYSEMAKLPPMSTCSGGPVSLSSVSLNFGNQQVGVKSAPLVETVTNNQSVSLNISSITAGGDFQQTNTCGNPVPPNGNCTISVYFTPSTTGTRTGTLTITDDASNSPQTASLTGVGATSAVTISPTSLIFNSQVLNTTSTSQKVTVTNSGFVNLTINSVAASGDFGQTGTCSGATLTPGQTCTVTVTFTPVVNGAISGILTINDTSTGAPHLVSLTGTGQLAVSISSNLSFAATNVGSTAPAQNMTVTNNQSTTLNYTFATSGDYSAVGNGTSPCNGTLNAKAKCTVGVSFTPTTNGLIKGALTITPNGAGSPIAAGGMTGTGQNGPTAPLTFSPASLSFGNVVLNISSSKTTTIKNVTSAAISLTSITGSGFFTAAPSGSNPCGSTLNAAASCTITVTYTPTVLGSSIGAVTVVDNASTSTQVQNEAGTGILAVALSPTSLSFGTVSVGSTSAVKVVTVTNNMPTALPITSVAASGDFISTMGGSLPCGATIPANSICTLGVEFSPTVTGTLSGELTLSYSGAGSSPQIVGLTGTGQ
jgi:Abnormal spindle-like microcephaly-assoc'd, ASPM-SPD-2-Hydin